MTGQGPARPRFLGQSGGYIRHQTIPKLWVAIDRQHRQNLFGPPKGSTRLRKTTMGSKDHQLRKGRQGDLVRQNSPCATPRRVIRLSTHRHGKETAQTARKSFFIAFAGASPRGRQGLQKLLSSTNSVFVCITGNGATNTSARSARLASASVPVCTGFRLYGQAIPRSATKSSYEGAQDGPPADHEGPEPHDSCESRNRHHQSL